MTPPSCRISVKVIPNAPRNEIVGWLAGSLKIKLHAPPTDGKANEALCRYLGEVLGISARSVKLLQGATSRHKVIEVTGLDLAGAKERLDR